MCFSAQASFIVAAGLTILGSVAVFKSKTTSLRLLASCILFFALQQALEGIVWMTLEHNDATSISHWISTYGFLFFALIFWPIWLPYLLYRMEKNPQKKKRLHILGIVGAIFASCSFIELCLYPIKSEIIGHHITYDIIMPYTLNMLYTLYCVGITFYIFATIVAFFVSSIRYMWVMGTIGTVTLLIAFVAYWVAVGSVWCFFAAVSSSLIYFIIQQEQKER